MKTSSCVAFSMCRLFHLASVSTCQVSAHAKSHTCQVSEWVKSQRRVGDPGKAVKSKSLKSANNQFHDLTDSVTLCCDVFVWTIPSDRASHACECLEPKTCGSTVERKNTSSSNHLNITNLLTGEFTGFNVHRPYYTTYWPLLESLLKRECDLL